jgi:CheY-like chemotaxis protein
MNEGLKEQVYGSLNERQLQALKTVERSGLHLLELINDILDLAKIESGQVELEYTPVSVFHLCQSSLAFVRQQAQKKHIQIETKLPLGLPDLMVDERRIRQVLINLLNNAVKFTLGGGLISLEVKQVYSDYINDNSHPHQFLRISIVDTGIGISSENVKKLFQPFIQVDSALNRRYEGTGLGLALVKRIIELHGGQVGLTSQLGVGSCFMIDLPYVISSLPSKTIAVDRVSAPPVIEKPSICKSDNAAHLILLVEDNETNIRIVSDYLQSDGYRILLAKNGLEAIALAKTHHPDLILMDIQMPIMDGLEATKQIRLDPQLLHTPIIALTALVMAGDRDRCLAAGASAYLPKPVKLKELSLNIQKFLSSNTLRSNPNPEES